MERHGASLRRTPHGAFSGGSSAPAPRCGGTSSRASACWTRPSATRWRGTCARRAYSRRQAPKAVLLPAGQPRRGTPDQRDACRSCFAARRDAAGAGRENVRYCVRRFRPPAAHSAMFSLRRLLSRLFRSSGRRSAPAQSAPLEDFPGKAGASHAGPASSAEFRRAMRDLTAPGDSRAARDAAQRALRKANRVSGDDRGA